MAELAITDVRKSFGSVEVLKGINLDVKSGEFVALVGPSGCGKSTLLAIIAGLEKATSGTISIRGRVVNHVAPKDRDIAMVFQSYALYPTMTVRENMMFGMEARGVPASEREIALKRVSGLLQIDQLLNRKPGQLSGGQRQRVAMGRALVRDPALFLFDEPLSNLDAKLRIEMRGEIKKLHQQIGKTTVYVTHDQVEAMTLASRIAVLNKGELQQFDEPQNIYDSPANMFVAGFMGSPSMNFLPGQIEGMGVHQRLVLAQGTKDEAKLRLGRAASAVDGKKVTVGIRPEHFTQANAKGANTLANTLKVTVSLVEPTGSETHVLARFGSSEVTAKFFPNQAPKLNEVVRLAVDAARICLFDSETGQALA
jgi:multiple sugar transport system ATP-binding protein